MIRPAWIETVFEWRPVRWAAAIFFLGRGGLLWLAGRRYRAIVDYCWIVRVSKAPLISAVAERVIFGILAESRLTGSNPLLDWYRADPASRACANRYTLSGRGSRDLFRDLIVLKAATAAEKGVILLKYVQTFNAAAALLDLDRIMKRYIFVLEPCWAGYCDPGLMMFAACEQPVVVQCFTEEDYRFVSRVGAPFVAVRLGPADWVDAEVFDLLPMADKRYDLVMVANWASHKRHALLFRALGRIRERDVRVLLVGFPWGGRTAADVRRDAQAMRNSRVKVEIVESIPHAELAALLAQCKVLVFLSRKEGDNKALVEAMFADVPVIVYDKTVGGASSRVNTATGVLTSERDLANSIRHMLSHYRDFSPRKWALDNTGSAVATRILDDAIRRAITAVGGAYTTGIGQKTNAPNLAYKDRALRGRFKADYEFILSSRI